MYEEGSDMAQAKKLEELFHDTLKDIYFAERKSSQFCRDAEGRPIGGIEEGLREAPR